MMSSSLSLALSQHIRQTKQLSEEKGGNPKLGIGALNIELNEEWRWKVRAEMEDGDAAGNGRREQRLQKREVKLSAEALDMPRLRLCWQVNQGAADCL